MMEIDGHENARVVACILNDQPTCVQCNCSRMDTLREGAQEGAAQAFK